MRYEFMRTPMKCICVVESKLLRSRQEEQDTTPRVVVPNKSHMATQKYHYVPFTTGLSSRRRRLCNPEGTPPLTTQLCNIFTPAKLEIAALMLPKVKANSNSNL